VLGRHPRRDRQRHRQWQGDDADHDARQDVAAQVPDGVAVAEGTAQGRRRLELLGEGDPTRSVRAGALEARIETLQPRIETPEPRIETLQPRIETLQPRIERLKLRIERLEPRIERLEPRME